MGSKEIPNIPHSRDPEESKENQNDPVSGKYLHDIIKDFGKNRYE